MVRMARILAAVAPLWAGSALAAQATPVHVRGDVVGQEGTAVKVATASGQQVELEVPGDTPVAQVQPAQLSDLSKGEYVGTTTVRQDDGTLRAVEVHIFPPSMRGAGEGQRPWDRGPGRSMTNGTVGGTGSGGDASSPPGASAMTNATVSSAAPGAGGQTLQLQYQGGSATVAVPPGTPVVKLAPGTRALLTPGAHVFAIAARRPDGTLVAERVTVGEGAVVPPM